MASEWIRFRLINGHICEYYSIMWYHCSAYYLYCTSCKHITHALIVCEHVWSYEKWKTETCDRYACFCTLHYRYQLKADRKTWKHGNKSSCKSIKKVLQQGNNNLQNLLIIASCWCWCRCSHFSMLISLLMLALNFIVNPNVFIWVDLREQER